MSASIPEVINRDAKASKMATYIHRVILEATLKTMHDSWKDADWNRWAEYAGCKSPSEVTRVLVVQKLKEMMK